MRKKKLKTSKLSLLLQPFKAVWYRSWTKFLGWTQAVSGATLLTLGEMHSYVSDPTIKDYLGQMDLPKSFTIGLAALGIVTWIAHGRDPNA